MKKISYWAKDHVWQTRCIIIISYFLLAFLGNVIGKLLLGLNIIIPHFLLSLFFTIACLIFTFYPAKKKGKYTLIKSFDFLLILSFFFIIVFSANQKSILPGFGNLFASSFITPHDTTESFIENRHIISFIEKINHTESTLSLKQKKQVLKKQIKEIRQDKELSKNEKTGLIIVSMLVALLLMMLVAATACSVACAGSGTGGLLILLGGWFLTLFFFARTMNYISRGPRKRVLMKRQEPIKKTTDSPI